MLEALDESMDVVGTRNADTYELLLDMMMDIVKSDANMASQIKTHFETKGVCETGSGVSNRARFKIRDIMTAKIV